MPDGRPVGYAVLALGFSLEFGGRSAFLDELYVEPASRGLGIGAAALRLLQETCRELGARSFALEVSLDNAGAERLYRREGFAANGRQLMTRRIRAIRRSPPSPGPTGPSRRDGRPRAT